VACCWLPEGRAGLEQESWLPRAGLEVQRNELGQLIAFSLTQSHARDLIKHLHAEQVGRWLPIPDGQIPASLKAFLVGGLVSVKAGA